jgi:dolichol kinase
MKRSHSHWMFCIVGISGSAVGLAGFYPSGLSIVCWGFSCATAFTLNWCDATDPILGRVKIINRRIAILLTVFLIVVLLYPNYTPESTPPPE